MNPAQYYRILSRQPKITQGTRFAVVTPYPHKFTPMPGMSPEQIAFGKGVDADEGSVNPYPSESPLAAHWDRGYNAPD